ncbi:hypothetical protein Sipo8835_22940 [Streptomyces ipomoeae]|uniref:Uncharacterized protein n=1 Tax=Streptomyces ipomoeae TaxID=103232 RepID=A0AAE9AYW3_9ACTN|nr:hypothetical protein [Streptomyces ipomoeae]TQE30936.1 hypothetical protein Sipo8835_22940 [Streptomyces ipomoeae]
MGRQGRWAIVLAVVMLALTGGIVAVTVESSEPELSVKEQAQRDLDKVLEIRELGKSEGLALWENNKAAGSAPVAALPDERACQDRWNDLELAKTYGEGVAYQFVRACQDEPPKQMTG